MRGVSNPRILGLLLWMGEGLSRERAVSGGGGFEVFNFLEGRDEKGDNRDGGNETVNFGSFLFCLRPERREI